MSRRLDWRGVLRERGVPFIEKGKNVGRGEIAIRCPWCGSADPSMHMGINLDTGWWSCWRNRMQHSGKSPVRLLVQLLGINVRDARELAGLSDDYVDPDGFADFARGVLKNGLGSRRAVQERPQDMQWPKEDGWRPLAPRGLTRRHWDYMTLERDFDPVDFDVVVRDYELGACTSGRNAHRVLLPYIVHGRMVAYTGRAIRKDMELRYLDAKHDLCVIEPRRTLYNHDALLAPARWLVVVEGPVDALKLDAYGKRYGVRAVALSTNSATEQQLYLLAEYASTFTHMGCMMDASLGGIDNLRIMQELRLARPDVRALPPPAGLKDAGAADAIQIEDYARALP